MYSIVLEKEEKLIEMMKMNGLKMINYWAVILLILGILSIFFNPLLDYNDSFFISGILFIGVIFFY